MSSISNSTTYFFVVKRAFPPAQNRRQRRRQTFAALMPQFFRHAVERLSDAASNGGEGVAVAAEGHRRAQRVFKICAFQKCNNSLRYGFLAALYMMVGEATLLINLSYALQPAGAALFFLGNSEQPIRRVQALRTHLLQGGHQFRLILTVGDAMPLVGAGQHADISLAVLQG